MFERKTDSWQEINFDEIDKIDALIEELRKLGLEDDDPFAKIGIKIPKPRRWKQAEIGHKLA